MLHPDMKWVCVSCLFIIMDLEHLYLRCVCTGLIAWVFGHKLMHLQAAQVLSPQIMVPPG